MAQAKRKSFLDEVMNNKLDETLITLKNINREAPSTLREDGQKYSELLFNKVLESYEKYLECLPPPGTMLSSKDNLVVHNLRHTLSGAIILFESRFQRFLRDYSVLIKDVDEGRRKRPAGRETAKKQAFKDPLSAISLIADGAAALPCPFEPLEDFDLSKEFHDHGRNERVHKTITMEEVPPRRELPPFAEELQLCADTLEFEELLAFVNEALDPARPPAELPSFTEFPVVATEPLRDEIQPTEKTPPLTGIPRMVLEQTGEPQEREPLGMDVREAPTQITPPLAGIPRIVLKEATGSRDQESLEVKLRKRFEELAAQEAAKPEVKRTCRKKRTLPVGFLKKKNSFRVNYQLTSERVNKIVDKGSEDTDILRAKWLRKTIARPDPYGEKNLLKEAEACVYQYKHWKRYIPEMDDDDEIDMVVQCLQEEAGIMRDRTPLRAGLSRIPSSVMGQAPGRHAAPSPSPHQPDSEIQVEERRGDQDTPLLPIPPATQPDGDQDTPLLPVPPPTLRDREHTGDQHTPLLPVPPATQPDGDQDTPLLPVPPPTLKDREHIRDHRTPSLPVLPPTQPDKRQIGIQHTPVPPPTEEGAGFGQGMEVDDPGVPIPGEADLSAATLAQNALERKEELRIKVVGKIRQTFAGDPSAVLVFTDLCPVSSSKFDASQTFSILIELWGEREVNLSQDSPNPQHIYIRTGKRYNSSTETCSDSSILQSL